MAADLQQVEVDLYGLKGRVNQYFFAVLAAAGEQKKPGDSPGKSAGPEEVVHRQP